jgi:hypothetical protein
MEEKLEGLYVQIPRVKHVSFSPANNSERDKAIAIATDQGIVNLGSSPERSILSPKFRRKNMSTGGLEDSKQLFSPKFRRKTVGDASDLLSPNSCTRTVVAKEQSSPRMARRSPAENNSNGIISKSDVTTTEKKASKPPEDKLIDPDALEKMWLEFKSSQGTSSSKLFGTKPKSTAPLENGINGDCTPPTVPVRKKRNHKLFPDIPSEPVCGDAPGGSFSFPVTDSFDILEQMLHGTLPKTKSRHRSVQNEHSSQPAIPQSSERMRTVSESNAVDLKRTEQVLQDLFGAQEENFQPDWLTSEFVRDFHQSPSTSDTKLTNDSRESLSQPLDRNTSVKGSVEEPSRGRDRSRSNDRGLDRRQRSRSAVPIPVLKCELLGFLQHPK